MLMMREALRAIQAVNRYVNAKRSRPRTGRRAANPRTDAADQQQGDREDYALLKTKTLLDIGFPTSKLALVALDRNGGNHLVLIARLKSGDYARQSRLQRVKPWQRTGYTFLEPELQSQGCMAGDAGGPRRAVHQGLGGSSAGERGNPR